MFSLAICIGYSLLLSEHKWKVLVTNNKLSFQKVIIEQINTTQKVKFSIKDFFSKCDKTRRKLQIWSHLLKKSLMENFIFCAV